MKLTACLTLAALLVVPAMADEHDDAGFQTLFDGKSLEGWKKSAENPESFKLEDGAIVAHGPRAHLFYTGADKPFDDFILRMKVMTKPNANGGIYFHTKYQEEGWPAQGHEAQVNNSFKPDPRKTGSIYRVKDILNDSPVEDNEWFDYEIKVQGQQITISLNGKKVNEYTEPEGGPPDVEPGRRLSEGTFALQAHDPGSIIHYKDIKVKRLSEK